MTEAPPKPYGSPVRGVTQADVSQAADALLRAGERPTVEKIRAAIGSGSPNTVGPLLDGWWKRLAGRLDAGPAALHRLPESVAHVAEALWMQALDEGRRRAAIEQHSTQRALSHDQQALEIRSHVLSLREGELDARLKDRERDVEDLRSQLRALQLTTRKDQAMIEAQGRRVRELETELLRAKTVTAPQPPATTTSKVKRVQGRPPRESTRVTVRRISKSSRQSKRRR